MLLNTPGPILLKTDTAVGRRRRPEFEYTRHGTQSLLCAFEVHRGRVVAACGCTRTAADLVRFMDTVAAQYPTGPPST